MQIVTFLDLDDLMVTETLIDRGEAELLPVAWDEEGLPVSFMTPAQRALFDLFNDHTILIPVTSLSRSAYFELDLPFRSPAIVSGGGVILQSHGAPDIVWDATIRPEAQGQAPLLSSLLGEVEDYFAGRKAAAEVELVRDWDMPLYISIKFQADCEFAREKVQKELLRRIDVPSYSLQRKNNHLFLLPPFLKKDRAVRYLLDHYFHAGPVAALGMGDGWGDVPFLQKCDFLLLPRESPLAEGILG